ncbi:MAG TPA: substrate-binding domain-containing protein [Bacillota bacterium]|nr:substrate-binding domain-containing protein [Bacillota bacterium]
MKRSSKLKGIISVIMAAVLLLSTISFAMAATAAQKKAPLKLEPEITLATTTSTQDSGLLDVMIPAFEKRYKVKVKVVAVGSGQAIELGKKKDADVLLVHSRKAEDEFMGGGFGLRAWDLMYNQFLIVGPANDPAKISGSTSALDAFKKIAASGAKFISRGDKSGTNTKELSIWDKAGIKPSGSWYVSAGLGMGETIKMAEEMGAYTLVDEATFLTVKSDLKVLCRGDKVLFNPYGIIEVKGNKKHNSVNEFIWFFISPKGQKMISDFGKAKYGKSLFVPSVKKR